MTNDIEPLLLKPMQAADLLGVGRSKIYQLISDGTIPSIRIGGSVRVPVAALRSWLKQQEAGR